MSTSVPPARSFRVRHDDAGIATLIARVRPFTPTVVVLEATGGYEVTVAAALGGARLPVAVVNPRQIRDFARATGQLGKTDTLDARVIARFIVGGRAHVRRILYMATVTAIKHNPVIRAFFHRLVTAGRPGKVAVIAAMRKLPHYPECDAPRPQAVANRLTRKTVAQR